MSKLEKLLERINRNGEFYAEGTPIPMLSLNEFFDGNDVIGSICCNLEAEPHPREVERVLRRIEDLEGTEKVYVQVTEMDIPEWPFSDTVWVVTSLDIEEIKQQFPQELAPDEFWEGFIEGEDYEKIEIPAGCKVVACWWD